MAIFKFALIAVMAFINVALSSTAFSSEAAPAVTSVQFITSILSVSALPSAESNKTCATDTVTELAPPETVTVTATAGVSFATTTATANETKTVTFTSTRSLHHTSSVLSTSSNATSVVSAPTQSSHGNSSATATGTGGHASASASASYTGPYSTPPPFNAAAYAANVGAAAIAGGIFVALLGI